MRGFWVSLTFLLVVTGCAKNSRVQTGPAPDRVAYDEGVKAFREGTPEGYQRASQAFRRATIFLPASCEYALQLAQSLTFLAHEQKYNWEDFEPRVSEATTILDARQQDSSCTGLQTVADRVRAHAMYLHDATKSKEYLALLNRALDTNPDDALAWVVLSKLQPSDRRNPMEHALALAPDLPLVQFEYGNALLNRPGGLAKAKEAFERTLVLNPRHYQALVGQVYSLGTEDYSDQIEPLLQRAIDIAPAYLRARMLLGDYYAGMEEIEKAAEHYKTIVLLNAKFYPAHLALGIALMTAERLNEAEASFLNLLKLDVKTPQPPMNGVDYSADCQAHYYLGNIWLERGNTDKAKVEYVAALGDISNHMDSVYGLAFALYQEGNVDGALVEFNRVLTSAPKLYPTAYTARAGIRVIRRQFMDAAGDYAKAIELYRQDLVVLDARLKSDEAKGWTRKAEGDRRRKLLMESRLQKAIDAKKAIDSLLGGGPDETN